MNYRIGIDGGGSKTECILIDPKGQVVARRLAPGCNPSLAGPDEARAIVTEALCALADHAGGHDPKSRISATLLCMAGSGALWQKFADGLTNFGKVIAVNDSLPVLELATRGGAGLVIHAGTGSFVAAREQPFVAAGEHPFVAASEQPVPSGVERVVPNALGDVAGPTSALGTTRSTFGAVHYAGGLGWRLGDPGSGYDIGRRAIGRAILELQGWMTPSGLGKLVRQATGLSGHLEVKRYYYSESTPASAVAGLAPAVLQLASEGDLAAREAAVESAAELLNLALRVAAKVFPATPLKDVRAGLSGHVLIHPVVRQALAAMSGLVLHPVEEAPIEGVRRLLVNM